MSLTVVTVIVGLNPIAACSVLKIKKVVVWRKLCLRHSGFQSPIDELAKHSFLENLPSRIVAALTGRT